MRQLVYNYLDALLIFFFYLVILNLSNFWTQLYTESICEMLNQKEMSIEESTEANKLKLDELVEELIISQHTLKRK